MESDLLEKSELCVVRHVKSSKVGEYYLGKRSKKFNLGWKNTNPGPEQSLYLRQMESLKE